jgi:hypothetical protein
MAAFLFVGFDGGHLTAPNALSSRAKCDLSEAKGARVEGSWCSDVRKRSGSQPLSASRIEVWVSGDDPPRHSEETSFPEDELPVSPLGVPFLDEPAAHAPAVAQLPAATRSQPEEAPEDVRLAGEPVSPH